MDDSGFPMSVQDVVATLVEIFQHRRLHDIAELLRESNARIEETNYDNWNGGTYTYELMLGAPIRIFAGLGSKIADVEKSISGTLASITRGYSNHHLESVTITPLSNSKIIRANATPSDDQVNHLWDDGRFRLFLSHISAHKVFVTALKLELRHYGISAFVAHEDIAPSREWQKEIELALGSMNALAALLTPDFHASNWTDQEIGFALGRGIFVLPVRLGADPYGFVGRVQGVPGALTDTKRLAQQLAHTLLGHNATHCELRRAVVSAWASVFSRNDAVALSDLICKVNDFTNDEKMTIQRACTENDQLRSEELISKKVLAAIGKPVWEVAKEVVEDIPL